MQIRQKVARELWKILKLKLVWRTILLLLFPAGTDPLRTSSREHVGTNCLCTQSLNVPIDRVKRLFLLYILNFQLPARWRSHCFKAFPHCHALEVSLVPTLYSQFCSAPDMLYINVPILESFFLGYLVHLSEGLKLYISICIYTCVSGKVLFWFRETDSFLEEAVVEGATSGKMGFAVRNLSSVLNYWTDNTTW